MNRKNGTIVMTISALTSTSLLGCTKNTDSYDGAAPSIASKGGGEVKDIEPSHPAYHNAVALVDAKKNSKTPGWAFCSGNLYENGWVITAMHCVVTDYKKNKLTPIPTTNVEVFFGTDVEGSGTKLSVERIVVHGQADIALLKLTGGIPAAYSPLPILPTLSDLRVGDAILLAGFGRLEKGTNDVTGILRQGKAKISTVTAEKISTSPDPETTCTGDSGSAIIAVVNGKAYSAGVTHGGGFIWDSCVDVDGIYVPLPTYRSWIDGIVGKSDSVVQSDNSPQPPDNPPASQPGEHYPSEPGTQPEGSHPSSPGGSGSESPLQPTGGNPSHPGWLF